MELYFIHFIDKTRLMGPLIKNGVSVSRPATFFTLLLVMRKKY